MQQDLQLTLFILGMIAIPAVLLHGLWKIRKSSKQSKKASYESKDWSPTFTHEDEIDDAPMYDDVGVGKARVVINSANDPLNKSKDAEVKQETNPEQLDGADEPVTTGIAIDDVSVEFDNEQTETDEVKTTVSEETDTINVDLPKMADDSADELVNDKAEESLTYAPNVISLDKNNNAFEAKPNDTHATGLHAVDNSRLEESLPDASDTPVYSNVVTQPKPEFNKTIYGKDSDDSVSVNASNPPAFLLKSGAKKGEEILSDTEVKKDVAPVEDKTPNIDDIPDIANDPDFALNIQDGPIAKKKSATKLEVPKKEVKQLSFTEQAKRFVRRNKKTVAQKIRKEPALKNNQSDDQMRIDFDDTDAQIDTSTGTPSQVETTSQQSDQTSNNSKPVEATDVLVLNVRSADDNPIQGAALLPLLLTLGFKFGEHDIFHRHVNTNGKGPILFSLTNMFKPGVFDIDNIETFKTYGISLFMMLPIEGDAQQVFNMMHNAARKISDEFDCRILDGNKVGLSKQSLQQYVERIREFERKRKTQ